MIDQIKTLFPASTKMDGVEAILLECERQGLNDKCQIAYILATVRHETAGTMQPIKEYGSGKGRVYGKKIKQSGEEYELPNQIYFGRGFVQLTWYENYERFGKLLKIDLLNHPELTLTNDVAAKIIVFGMQRGMFTGKRLSDYFSDAKKDWVNARRIINSIDRANLIAGYAKAFFEVIE